MMRNFLAVGIYSFLCLLLVAIVHPSLAKQNIEKNAVSFAWHYQWGVAIQNEKALAALKVATILEIRCARGKQIYDNTQEVQKDCQEYKQTWAGAESEAIYQRLKSQRLIKILTGAKDDVSIFLTAYLSKQIEELETTSPLKSDHPEQWKKLLADAMATAKSGAPK